jgi:hypothetical protein
VFEFLAREIKQEKETKEIQLEKEKVTFPYFSDDIVLYLKDAKESKFLDLINAFSKIAGYKISI